MTGSSVPPEALQGQVFPAWPGARREGAWAAVVGVALAALVWGYWFLPEAYVSWVRTPLVCRIFFAASALSMFNLARQHILEWRRVRAADPDSDVDLRPLGEILWEILIGVLSLVGFSRWSDAPVSPLPPLEAITSSVVLGAVFPLIVIAVAVVSFMRCNAQVVVSSFGLVLRNGRRHPWFVPGERIESLTWHGYGGDNGDLIIGYRDERGRPSSREIAWGAAPDSQGEGALGEAVRAACDFAEDESARRDEKKQRWRVWRHPKAIAPAEPAQTTPPRPDSSELPF